MALYNCYSIYLVKSFVELTCYLLNLPCTAGHYLFSEHFSQDPLENYFGQQRARGGYSHNPTMQACIASAQSLRVQAWQRFLSGVIQVERNASSLRKQLTTHSYPNDHDISSYILVCIVSLFIQKNIYILKVHLVAPFLNFCFFSHSSC